VGDPILEEVGVTAPMCTGADLAYEALRALEVDPF
jgi:hypothetical protein